MHMKNRQLHDQATLRLDDIDDYAQYGEDLGTRNPTYAKLTKFLREQCHKYDSVGDPQQMDITK